MATSEMFILMDGKSDSKEVAEEIFNRILRIAEPAVSEAATEQYKRTIEDIKTGYKTAGFPAISESYARKLVMDPEFGPGRPPSGKWDPDEIDLLADQLIGQKTGLRVRDILLEAVSLGVIETSGNEISSTVTSAAKYSKDLEEGLLFGKPRTHQERRFFTRHYIEVSDILKESFFKHLADDVAND